MKINQSHPGHKLMEASVLSDVVLVFAKPVINAGSACFSRALFIWLACKHRMIFTSESRKI